MSETNSAAPAAADGTHVATAQEAHELLREVVQGRRLGYGGNPPDGQSQASPGRRQLLRQHTSTDGGNHVHYPKPWRTKG